jgi:VanZ family protein
VGRPASGVGRGREGRHAWHDRPIELTPAPTRRRWLLPAAVYVVILGLSSVPGERFETVGLPGAFAYLAHTIEYGALGAALRVAARDLARPLGVTVTLGALAGLLDELWQSTVPGRTPSLVDLGVDVAAVTVAALVVGRVLERRG